MNSYVCSVRKLSMHKKIGANLRRLKMTFTYVKELRLEDYMAEIMACNRRDIEIQRSATTMTMMAVAPRGVPKILKIDPVDNSISGLIIGSG